MENLEQISCPLCGSVREKFLYIHEGFKVVRCLECELVYINPRLSGKALEEMYNSNQISPQQYYEQNISQDIKHFGKRLAIIEKYKTRGTLLDIGTNIGTMLKVAKDKGWDVRGVEFNKSAANFGKEHFDVPIEVRDFMRTRFDAQSFDVVTMNDVIEHVTDPVVTLMEVYRILKDGGILFMTTPNISALLAKLSKSKWLHLKPNEHLSYFTPKTMRLLLDKTGYSMERVQSIGRIRDIQTILDKTKTYGPLSSAIAKVLPKKIKQSSIYVNPGDEMAVVARKRPAF